MNVRKTIFVVVGIGIILILLAIRLGWFGIFQKKPTTPQSNTYQTAAEPQMNYAEPTENATDVSQDNTPPSPPPQPQTPEENTPPPQTQEENTPPPQTPPPAAPGKKTEKKEPLGSGDPFTYTTTGTGDYTPLSGNKHVGAITVKGIIRINGEEPKAILHLRDSDRVHYVSKNSVVRVSTGSKNATSPAEVYIVVKDIRNDEVELIQLERPDKVIIIR